jgi:hypothetical protein
MAANYSNSSPWANTSITNGYLGYFKIRPVSAEVDDQIYTIEPQYTYRPDLLSYDLYGTPRLWWVFAQRNLDVLEDPIYDFVAGTTIRLPQKANLFKLLGL